MEFKYLITMGLLILFILISMIIAKNTGETIVTADPLTSFYNLEANSIKGPLPDMPRLMALCFVNNRILLAKSSPGCTHDPCANESPIKNQSTFSLSHS